MGAASQLRNVVSTVANFARVCHLAQALVEAHLVVGKLRGEAVELPSQQACGNQLLFHHHNALGEED